MFPRAQCKYLQKQRKKCLYLWLLKPAENTSQVSGKHYHYMEFIPLTASRHLYRCSMKKNKIQLSKSLKIIDSLFRPGVLSKISNCFQTLLFMKAHLHPNSNYIPQKLNIIQWCRMLIAHKFNIRLTSRYSSIAPVQIIVSSISSALQEILFVTLCSLRALDTQKGISECCKVYS